MPGIFLAGFMGSGKTTIGKALASKLGWAFADLDADIESSERTPIAELFDKHGEAGFRNIETIALKSRLESISRGDQTVVALGGGAFVQPANVAMLKGLGVSLWLDCPMELALRRIGGESNRPLARDPEQFKRLYESRRPHYAKADYRVEVLNDKAVETAAAIIRMLEF